MKEEANDEFTFTWIIENFSMCHQSKGEFIYSPKFALNSLPGIKWYINVYPRGRDSENNIAVYLKRADHIRKNCNIKFSIQGFDCDEKLIFCPKESINIFTTENGWGTTPCVERNKLLRSLINDILIIKCTLKPVCGTNEQEILPPLSYKNGLFTDVVIRAGYAVFKVHKAILWARWPKLAEKLGAEATCEEILDIEPNVLETIIKYVYTGKLDCSKPDLLVKVYVAAAKYELPNLHYMPVVAQKALIRINIEEISFEWEVENFSNLPINTVLNSHIFSVDILKSCKWNLMLCMRKIMENYRVFDISLCKIYDSKSKPIFVRSKISFNTCHYYENEHLFCTNQRWVCANFIQSSYIRSNFGQNALEEANLSGSTSEGSFVGVTLEVKCEFKFSDSDYFSEIMKSSRAFVPSINCQYFSSDFQNLYKSGRFSDINIVVGSKTYSAHKCVLCARSSVFSRMFETKMTESKVNRFEIADVDPDIMDEMLVYMYSGYLEKPLEETAEKLYAAADKYDVSALKKKCSSFLKSNLTAKNVCTVLQLANKHSDDDLYKSILEFASAHAEDIFSISEWKEIVKDNLIAKLLQDMVLFCKKKTVPRLVTSSGVVSLYLSELPNNTDQALEMVSHHQGATAQSDPEPTMAKESCSVVRSGSSLGCDRISRAKKKGKRALSPPIPDQSNKCASR